MGESISLRKGFTEVEAQADPARLVAGMEETAQWPAVKRLRSWERGRLRISAEDAVLDVGCGAADVLAEIAGIVGHDGQAVGVDASEQMLTAARARAESLGVSMDLRLGDAGSLPFDDETFDVVRCERTLQWVDDPTKAIAEFVRVLRPGGRVCVTDTDWRTLLPDHPSPELVGRFFDAMAAIRGDKMSIGSRLVNLLRDAGVAGVDATAETHMWLAWDPD